MPRKELADYLGTAVILGLGVLRLVPDSRTGSKQERRSPTFR